MSLIDQNVLVGDAFSQPSHVNQQPIKAQNNDDLSISPEISNSLLHKLLKKLNNALKKQERNRFSSSTSTFQENILAVLDNILRYVSCNPSQETTEILSTKAAMDILSRSSKISLEHVKIMHMKQRLLAETLPRFVALDRVLPTPVPALKATVNALSNYTTLHRLLHDFIMVPFIFEKLDEKFEKFQKIMNFIHDKINCPELKKFHLQGQQQKVPFQPFRTLIINWYRTLTKMYSQIFEESFPNRHQRTLAMSSMIRAYEKENQLQKMLSIFRDTFRLLNTPQERWEFVQIFDRHTGMYHHGMTSFHDTKPTIDTKVTSFLLQPPPLPPPVSSPTPFPTTATTATTVTITNTTIKRPFEDLTPVQDSMPTPKKMKIENDAIALANDLYNTSSVPDGIVQGNEKDIIRQQQLAAAGLRKMYTHFKKRQAPRWQKKAVHELHEAIVHLVKYHKLTRIDHAALSDNISKAIEYVTKTWEKELYEKTPTHQDLWNRLAACRQKFQTYQKSLQDPSSKLNKPKKQKKVPATPADQCRKLLAKFAKHQDVSPLTRQMILLQQELQDAMSRAIQQQQLQSPNDDQKVICKKIEQEMGLVENFHLHNDDLVVNNPVEEMINCLEDMDYLLRQDRLEMRKTKSSTFTRDYRLLWFQVLGHVLEFISQLPAPQNVYKIQVYHILQGLGKRNQIFQQFFLSNQKAMDRCKMAVKMSEQEPEEEEEDITV